MKEKGIQHILFVQNHDSSTSVLPACPFDMPNCLNDPNVQVGQEVKWSAPVLPDITLIETQPTQSIVTAEMCATLNPR